MRCAHIIEKTIVETPNASVLLPRLNAHLADCDQPGMIGTLLGGMQPLLATLDKPAARDWYKNSHAVIKAAPRCTPGSACPDCVDELPCPQDIVYQIVTQRAVGYPDTRLTARASRDDLYKPGRWRKIDTWTRAGMPEMAAYMMWLVICEYDRERNTTRVREMLGECIKRDLHLIEPRLTLEVGRYWADQRRCDDVAELVTTVMATATTDTAFAKLDVWFHASFLQSADTDARTQTTKARVDPASAKRRISPVETRPADRRHTYRYRVYQ
ncbi:MAG: hypothetical protein WCP28_18315 [Actinomycetes bacterium]